MWTEQKIQEYISNSVEENIHLDYKAALALGTTDGKKTEISKDVSSFANSDGGVIIYGVKEFDANEKRHLPERIDPIDRLQITKEWLEQIIRSNISPRIPHLKITPVTIGPAEENKVVYVVEIPKGTTAHQAKDKRYYRRYNFESTPMDDWEIKDIINRQQRTLIKIRFEYNGSSDELRTCLRSESNVRLKFGIDAVNRGNRIAEYVEIYLSGSEEVKKLITKPPTRQTSSGFQLYYCNEKEYKIKIEDYEHVVNIHRLSILPGTSRRLGWIEMGSNFIKNNLEMKVAITTEDNYISYKIKGIELLIPRPRNNNDEE